MADELDMIVISGGEISSGEIFGYGDTITVKSGGTLDDAYIPANAQSLTLEAGAILTDSITIGVNTLVKGEVDADEADINLDISDRQEEDGIIISDWSALVSANSISVTVDADQDKGSYTLAANAADFNQTITVKNTDGSTIGSISLSSMYLDHMETRYVLSLDQDDKLVFSVKSNIQDSTDKVFLYKNAALISSHNKAVCNITVSESSNIDAASVEAGGILEGVTLGSNGDLTLKSGGTITGLQMGSISSGTVAGSFHATFNKDDGTILTGTFNNRNFSFANNVAKDLVVSKGNISVNAGVTVDGLRLLASGKLYMNASSVLTGIVDGTVYCRPEIYINEAVVTDVTVVSDNDNCSTWEIAQSTISNSTIYTRYGRYTANQITNSTIISLSINSHYFSENTLADVTLGGEYIYVKAGNILTGSLTLQAKTVVWNSSVDANGNYIICDLGNKTETSAAMIDMNYITGAAGYVISVSANQVPGKYAVAKGVNTLNADFTVKAGGNTVGILNKDNLSVTAGNWVYSLVHDDVLKTLNLQVSLSADADKSVRTWKHNADGSIQTAEKFSGLTLNSGGVTVLSGGALEDSTVNEGGFLTIRGGKATGITLYDNYPQNAATPSLNLSLQENDGSVLSGVYKYKASYAAKETTISFSYADNRGENIVVTAGASAAISGQITINGVNVVGSEESVNPTTVNFRDGATLSGDVVFIRNGGYVYGTVAVTKGHISSVTSNEDAVSWAVIESEIEDSNIHVDSNPHKTAVFVKSTIEDTSINTKNSVRFAASTFSNVVLDGGKVFFDDSYRDNSAGFICTGVNELAGTLTLKADEFAWNSTLKANGYTIIADLSEKTANDLAMLNISKISDDVCFAINLKENQAPGSYAVAEKYGSFADDFTITVDNRTVGVLNAGKQSLTSGNWTYSLVHDAYGQTLALQIELAPNASKEVRTWKYLADGSSESAAEFTNLTVGDSSNIVEVAVLDGGSLSNSTLTANGMITLESGGSITGLDLQQYGILNASFKKDDGTILSGQCVMSEYNYDLKKDENVTYAFSFADNVGKNLLVTGGSSMTAYDGTTVDGAVIYGFYSIANGYTNGTLCIEEGATLTGKVTGKALHDVIRAYEATITDMTCADEVSDWYAYDCVIENSEFLASNKHIYNSYVSNSVFYDSVQICGGTLKDVTIVSHTGYPATFSGIYKDRFGLSHSSPIKLQGSLTLKTEQLTISGIIQANGNDVILDLTEKNTSHAAAMVADKFVNSELVAVVNRDQVLGQYALATKASKVGQGEEQFVWDIETNTWLYKGEVVCDLDGIVEVRDENGILIANCTVNGDTEYFGRYNYTVNVDANGNMNLTIGINSREGLSFAADGYDNDTFAKATKLNGNIGTLDKFTIDSASDVDYYKFTLDTAGRAASSIGIDFKMWKGDLDIYLYDSKGNLVDYAKSVTDNEVLSLHKLAAGDYYLKVVGYEGNTNEYTLNWNLPQVSTLQDATESGNDKAHSYYLGKLRESVSVNAAISDANDEDYFMFILEKGMTSADSISITYDSTEAELDFYIYGSNGKDLIGRGVESYENGMTVNTINFAGFKHGVYYVRVVSADGGAVDYTLNANIGSADVNPDKWENNNSIENASRLYTLNGEKTIEALSIHSDSDVDYFKFTILEDGSLDDYIAIEHEARLGDLDLEILDADGKVVIASRSAENTDKVSLVDVKAGEYYIKVSGYENTVNNYTLSYNFSNSSLIASDVFEGIENAVGAIDIRQSQTLEGLSIGSVKQEDETRADTFRITLDYDAWRSSKIILTDYRADWDGLKYVLASDAAGNNVISSGIGSEISLNGLKAGTYYLTVDTPVENQYSEYSMIAQRIPDSSVEVKNNWSIFIYLAGDNNLEDFYLSELLYMQQAILPEDVEVYVLMDRSPGYSTAQRDWSGTRVGKIRHSNSGVILNCPSLREESMGAVSVEWMYFDGVDTNTYVTNSNLDMQTNWDTGSISTLEAFLDWGMQTGRADNYALIMKDHGSSLGWNSSDETSNSMMSITEISDLLKQEKYDDISVIAFDQCLMGSDVVITEMENAVDYVVASEAVGYTPNQLMMYKVLFNNLETDMTAEELAEKMVASCNCSGRLDLTLAAFDTSDTYLSTALNDFASHAGEFTYADWTALCTSFGTAFNYGDEICAFSDLISVLKETLNFTVSSVLGDALNKLISDVEEYVIKAAQITPATYGNGLAVFNPVLSSDQMNQYYYVGGGALDYYTSSIGKMAWGDFLYTVGKLAGDVAEYMTEDVGKLTFNDFDYFFGEENKEVIINLGAFSGNGMTLEGLYVGESARFNFEMLRAGIEGDAIRIVADDPDANITISLIQTKPTLLGEEHTVRRTSTNGVLSLAGVDFAKAGVYSDYELLITTDRATSYTMSFEADWASGVDRFDFARTGSIDSNKGGNNILDKATLLAPGNYAGLMTYAGDADYYQLNTVYADELNVIISGTGLIVKEFDAAGNEIQSISAENGQYILKVKNGNYLYVEGLADITSNSVNSYTLQVSDVESTYLAYNAASLPDISIQADTETVTNKLAVTVTVPEKAESYYSSDLITWTKFEGTLYLEQNGLYYFKAVGETEVESNYVSLNVENIDNIAPSLQISGNPAEWSKSAVLTAVTDDETATIEFYDGVQWIAGNEFTVTANGTYQFRVTDAAGNSVTDSIVVNNIDKAAPDKPTAEADITSVTNGSVTVSAAFSNDTIVKEYCLDNKNWKAYTSGIKFEQNGTVYFRGKDAAGNISEVTSYEVTNIDKTAPAKPVVSADSVTVTNCDVTVAAFFSNDCIVKQYRIGDGEWQDYVGEFSVFENGTVYFRAEDAAGNESTNELVVANIDKAAPAVPGGFKETVSGYNATLDWSDASDTGVAGVKGYYVRYGLSDVLSGNGEFIAASEFDLTDLAVGTYFYQVKTEDKAGNISEWSAVQSFEIIPGAVQNLRGDSNGLSWDAIPGVESYIVEYSTDNFATVMAFETTGNKVDSIALPVGTYQWRVKAVDGDVVSNGNNITSQNTFTGPQEFVSDKDGNTDVFFANANGKWGAGYAAQHAGILNGWVGTNEQVTLTGKNKLADIFEGSTDANVLVLTDDTNGDALFVDDIYTALPGTVAGQQARIAQIDEIRAGAGDDIVDMTSQRFAYVGNGVKIYGGLGNDTIWSNNGTNTLFGDAGNDRIVGGSDADVIVGGIGNDSMHGGGGNDTFCFGENWGKDTVEQLDGGTVTLWFASDSGSWDEATLTYADGANSVTVSGVNSVTLKFGADSSLPEGVFADAASEKIFEDKNKGFLA